ncbi:ABC transporter permease [Halorientalis brevis]|uniref:ABC transporter permease n=1 Tax=Halorientalis brevis TaxID=1126241 RepID=A0ABD6CH77_9EURY|nr:ABC transporter permease subunit [Halorientalis brevis]
MLERTRHRIEVGWPASVAVPDWVRVGAEGAGAVLALLVGWQAVVWLTGLPAVLVPAPFDVAAAVSAHADLVLRDAVYTGGEIVLGWLTGVTVGMVLGFCMAASRRLRLFLYPLLIAVRIVPLVVFAPVFIVVLGPTLEMRILLAAILSFFPVVVATLDGLQSVPEEQVALLLSVGATRWQRLAHVHLPNALPSAVAGVKIATPLAVEGVVIAEFLAASKGVGHGMVSAVDRLDTALLFGYMLVLIAIGLAVFVAVIALERAVSWDTGGDAFATDQLWTPESASSGGAVTTGVVMGIALVALTVGWEAAATAVPHARLFLAGPQTVGDVLLGSPALFVAATVATLEKLAAGWALGATVGITVGTVAALFPRLRTGVYTYLVGFRVMPVIAFAPVLLVWFGVSFAAGALLVAAAVFFPIAIGTATGLRQLPETQRDLFRLVAAPPHRTALVRLRYAAPTLLAGCKLSIVTGLSGAIVAEWFVAADGLGLLVLQQTRTFQPALSFGAIAVLFACGSVLFALTTLLQRSLRW